MGPRITIFTIYLVSEVILERRKQDCVCVFVCAHLKQLLKMLTKGNHDNVTVTSPFITRVCLHMCVAAVINYTKPVFVFILHLFIYRVHQ